MHIPIYDYLFRNKCHNARSLKIEKNKQQQKQSFGSIDKLVSNS